MKLKRLPLSTKAPFIAVKRTRIALEASDSVSPSRFHSAHAIGRRGERSMRKHVFLMMLLDTRGTQ